MFKFQRLEVWQKSVKLNRLCIHIADSLNNKYQFSFGDQLRRAVLSISNNIAEGSGRATLRDQTNFYNMAKGSVYEVVNILAILKESNIFTLDDIEKKEIYQLADEISMMLTGLMRRSSKA